MRLTSARRRLVGAATVALALSGAVVLASPASSQAAAIKGAVSTTTNLAAGTGACQNGPSDTDPVNCNHYAAKQDVWLSGLPQTIEDGEYFFAVLEPGGQNDPNDGSPKNLSDDVDNRAARQFTVSGGAITAASSHQLSGGKVQLADYATTTNPGGVYIMAVCQVPAGGGDVDPSDCKYDAFKVDEEVAPTEEADPLTITKDAEGSYEQKYTWGITKSVNKNVIKTYYDKATFKYTVKVTPTAQTPTAVEVHGTINVFNPNQGAVTGVDVTDVLSDGTVCTVQGGTDATVQFGDNAFPYTCSLTSKPQAQLDNTATATWDGQDVTPDGVLAGGSASFTFSDVPFTENTVDECVVVSDTFDVGRITATTTQLGTSCVGGTLTYTYTKTVKVPAKYCKQYVNKATFLTTDTSTGPLAPAKVTVKVCRLC